MRLLVWAIIQYGQCPYEEMRIQIQRLRPCENTGERWPWAVKDRSLRRNQPFQHFGLRLLTYRIVSKYTFCCFTVQCLSYGIPSKPTLVLIKHLNFKKLKKTGVYLLINGTKHIFQDPIKYLELDQANGCSVHQLTCINWVPTRNRECNFPTQDIMSQNLGFKKISRVVDFHSKVWAALL